MALWKDQNTSVKEPPPPPAPPPVVPMPVDQAIKKEFEPRIEPLPTPRMTTPSMTDSRTQKESVITDDLTIEGKIEGTGHVRIAGKFKGDINVQGNLVIEPNATVTGSVRAKTITIGGHLEGNVDGATRVELLETGVLIGDVTADSLTVAAGSKMRGKAEFGWPEKGARTQ